MEISTSKLDEVQIIAYGTSSQRFQTGNVSSIKAKDIEKSPVSNPLLALQARVPGLNITQGSGLPGGAMRVRVQGENSIANGNTPLYVVDGVPYPSSMPGRGMAPLGSSNDRVINGVNTANTGSALSYLLPSDIESIEVLKDADATAIYGSRAANGAILITTKKAKAGKNTLDINFQTGWSKLIRRIDMLNTQQYLEMRWEALYNDSIADPVNYESPDKITAPDLLFWDTTVSTDWQKELLGGSARNKTFSAGLSGGNEYIKYLIKGTYQKETTLLPGHFSDQKGSMHFNINSTSLNRKFNIQFSGTYFVDNNQLPGGDIASDITQLPPNAPALV